MLVLACSRRPSDFLVANAQRNGYKNELFLTPHSSYSHHLSITHHVTVSGQHLHPLFFFFSSGPISASLSGQTAPSKFLPPGSDVPLTQGGNGVLYLCCDLLFP